MKKKKLILPCSIVVLVLLAALALPNFLKPEKVFGTNACVNNLSQIDAAKERWAKATQAKANNMPSWEDIRPYMPHAASSLPECPSGGTYTIGRIGQSPVCSVGGPEHSLPLK
jgi:hypothetical protein